MTAQENELLECPSQSCLIAERQGLLNIYCGTRRTRFVKTSSAGNTEKEREDTAKISCQTHLTTANEFNMRVYAWTRLVKRLDHGSTAP